MKMGIQYIFNLFWYGFRYNNRAFILHEFRNISYGPHKTEQTIEIIKAATSRVSSDKNKGSLIHSDHGTYVQERYKQTAVSGRGNLPGRLLSDEFIFMSEPDSSDDVAEIYPWNDTMHSRMWKSQQSQ